MLRLFIWQIHDKSTLSRGYMVDESDGRACSGMGRRRGNRLEKNKSWIFDTLVGVVEWCGVVGVNRSKCRAADGSPRTTENPRAQIDGTWRDGQQSILQPVTLNRFLILQELASCTFPFLFGIKFHHATKRF